MADSTALGDWTEQYAGSRLDLTGFHLTFADEFNTMSVGTSDADAGGAQWFAPVRPTFGAAEFVSPDAAVNPFEVADGALTITMEKVGGQWQSGHMQSINAQGEGFTQQYGYFEISAKFPAGAGSWPAFWLLSADSSQQRVEIDIIEAYGNSDVNGHHTAIHVTPKGNTALSEAVHNSEYTDITGSMFDGQFHTYGAMITPSWITIFYDGVELNRFPVTEYFRTPMYMCVDLAMYGKEASMASGEYEMEIDYVRAFSIEVMEKFGTAERDHLIGDWESNYLRGDLGDDILQGNIGFDDLNGNQGDDTIYGGEGDDWVVGGKDNDLLFGEQGGDIVYGNLGDDTCDGGADNDLIRGGQGNDHLAGGDGDDWLSGDRGDDTITGGAGADIFHGSGDAGADVVTDFNYWEGDRVVLDPGTAFVLLQRGGDAVVHMTSSELVLQGVTLSSLPNDWLTL